MPFITDLFKIHPVLTQLHRCLGGTGALALSDRSLWMDRGSCTRASRLENKHDESSQLSVVMTLPPCLGLAPWILKYSLHYSQRGDNQRWCILISVWCCLHFSSYKRFCGFSLVSLKKNWFSLLISIYAYCVLCIVILLAPWICCLDPHLHCTSLLGGPMMIKKDREKNCLQYFCISSLVPASWPCQRGFKLKFSNI